MTKALKVAKAYTVDSDVFPVEVYRVLRDACNGRRRLVTFRRGKDQMSSTEITLPPQLVRLCRKALGDVSRRTVYVKGVHPVGAPTIGKQREAEYLLSKGHTVQAVADALGVHRATVSRWTPSVDKRPRGYHGRNVWQDDSEAFERGRELLCSVGNVKGTTGIAALSRALKQPEAYLITRAEAAGFALFDLEREYSE